ncbi:MAG: L-aspartate oxidase [Planctomycetes bacterium]|nr:L-aspartate oxidase [Planctomycetota bacterium]MBU1517356.1 L-aspartate oxidase [Planctomycetota bacterium]MBU2457685.1 L-aspartate oxidase [Planctomycetota bacterium]
MKDDSIKLKRFDLRRYLVPINTAATQQLFTDCLIIGAGVAGLRAAIEAAGSGCEVVLISKKTLEDSNTWNAQGGIASVIGGDDSFASHIEDTLTTGCSINDREIVEQVVKDGPGLVKELLEWGAEFDKKQDGSISITLEGGHSHARIAHALGDNTGKAIAQALVNKVKQFDNITIIENYYTIDIVTDDDGKCLGAIGKTHKGMLEIIWAKTTILATGGAGRLYRETTNPEVATADGLAIAARAGAVLRDMEFMQFHPTTLYIAGASRALITETLRGEGAILRDVNNCAFMTEYHPDAELASRDIVSRAILQQMLKTNSTHVFLDIRHFDKDHFAKRFPLISEIVTSFDIDISKDLIPVRPSAHYMIGGIKTDRLGRTNIANLFACGEVASTGLHGANRLGSNSLLEGLVFGRIAGRTATGQSDPNGASLKKFRCDIPQSDRSRLDTVDVLNSLRSLMWRNVGITRLAKPLTEAQEIISFWQRYVLDKVFDSPAGWECQNMLTVCQMMAKAAEARTESRGVHFRGDFPETDDTKFKTHIEFA